MLRLTGIVKSFVIARLLGPAGNGLWQHFMLVFEYSQFAGFGVLEGLSKQLGHRIGSGDERAVNEARTTGMGGVCLVAAVLWIAFVIWALPRWEDLHPADRWGLPIVGLMVTLELVTNVYRSLLRAYSRIHVISSVAVAFALSNLILALILLPGLKILGALVAWVVTRAITTVWLVHKSGYRILPAWNPAVLKVLVITGFPIFLLNLTKLATRNIDRVLVDTVLDKADLGIYGLAVTVASLIRYAADAVGFVIYPIFLRKYGQTRDPRALAEQLVQPTMFLSVLVPAALGLSYLVLHLPILWLLPEFVASIEIFRLLTVSIVFSSLAILPSFYLIAIDRQRWLVVVGMLTAVFNYLVGFQWIEQGWGLAGVAAAMSTGLALHCTIVLLMAGASAFGSLASAAAWTVRTYLPVVYLAAIVLGIHAYFPRWLPEWGEVSRSLAEGAAFLLLSAPLLVIVERRSGFIRSLRSRRES